jgi:hypothetical protein
MGIGDIEKVAYAHGTFHSKSCTSGVGACPNAAASLHLVPVVAHLLGRLIFLNHSRPQKILVLEIRSLGTATKPAHYLTTTPAPLC